MEQEKFNELLDALRSERRRYANKVLKVCKGAGLTAEDPIHRQAIRQIASVDYELALSMMPTYDAETGKTEHPF